MPTGTFDAIIRAIMGGPDTSVGRPDQGPVTTPYTGPTEMPHDPNERQMPATMEEMLNDPYWREQMSHYKMQQQGSADVPSGNVQNVAQRLPTSDQLGARVNSGLMSRDQGISESDRIQAILLKRAMQGMGK